jgi:multidrug efflux pump subunit AcrA (membrane-fusion protein)
MAGAEAELALQETARARLDVEAANLRQELASQKRNSALAEAHYERTKALHDEGVGSQANVDEAERTWLIARNETDRLARELKLFPLRQREAESAVARAQAQCDTARLALSRTEVVAPFTGRVKAVQIEEGETVVSGASAVTLVDDSVLEIAVPLNSVDARQWLQFESGTAQGGGAWFGHLKRVGCTIHWTEGDDGGWEGVLDRVAEYDPESRTVTVVVRVSGEDRMGGDRFPLVEGMFCKVSIPGRVMAEVYRLAPHVVSFENTVYVARGTRLKTVPVEVLRMETDYTYVSSGLEPGDRVITTRLVNPLDNALLAIDEAPREEPES